MRFYIKNDHLQMQEYVHLKIFIMRIENICSIAPRMTAHCSIILIAAALTCIKQKQACSLTEFK